MTNSETASVCVCGGSGFGLVGPTTAGDWPCEECDGTGDPVVARLIREQETVPQRPDEPEGETA